MAREWLNLAEAADELEVSPRTIRRWVHAGRLPAELRPSAHGPQYFLPFTSVLQLHQEREVTQPPRRLEVERVVEVVGEYLDARERAFQEQQAALNRELQTVREQLRLTYDELTRAQQALWQQCQDLAQTQRTMQRLGEELTVTRDRARATRDVRRRQQAQALSAGDEDVA